MAEPLADLARSIISHLRQMDAEADTISCGYPTGLNWYGAHARPELTRPHTEPEWSKELARRLSPSGLVAEAEVAYPGASRERCDVVVEIEGGRRVWIEIKGAWREYWLRRGGQGIYESYLFHPLVEGLIAKSHTAASDIVKLGKIGPDDGAAVMFVLVGFERTDDPMDGDVARLEKLTGLGGSPWSNQEDSWDDARRPGKRVRVWVWWRGIE